MNNCEMVEHQNDNINQKIGTRSKNEIIVILSPVKYLFVAKKNYRVFFSSRNILFKLQKFWYLRVYADSGKKSPEWHRVDRYDR